MRAAILGALALAIPVCAVEYTNTWQRTFPLSGPGKLSISNINGSIRVTGDSGKDVRVTVKERYEASSPESLADLRKLITVSAAQQANEVTIKLETVKGDRRDHRDWQFRHEYEVQVPRDIALSLRTINGSELSVAGVTGEWDLKNINGAVEMTDVSGYGTAESLNGRVRANFTNNPAKPSTFKTLNGVIDVSFQPDLSAELAFSTLHGDAYTDFEIAPLTGSRNRRVRVGNGGIEHKFSTLNGSIKIRKSGKA